MAKRIINLHSNIQAPQLEQKNNTYEDYVQEYAEGFVTTMFSNGQLKTITEEQIKTWLSNPDKYYKELSNLMAYMYYTDGYIYQLYTLFTSLPKLNYKIKVFNNTQKGYEENMGLINSTMTRIKYKQLARDIIRQECLTGTVVATWLGDKKNPFLYIFDKQEYVFPTHRENGEWVCKMDLAWFDSMSEEERLLMFDTFKSVVSESDYDKYKKDTSNRDSKYITLPKDKTICHRVNTVLRNQRRGVPMGTQYLFNYLHKQTLKNLEKSIANKIIKNALVLTIGNKDKPNETINPKIKTKVARGVHSALKKNVNTNDTPVIVIPEYASLEFGKMDGFDGLDNKKYDAINLDISTDIGISNALMNGEGNGSTIKYNIEMLYNKIALLLEGVDEIFNKLLPIILPSTKANNFYIEFDKSLPLSNEKVLETFIKLHSEGFSVKAVLDLLPDTDVDEYIKRSIYEQDVMKLYETITPPQTSSTLSAKDTDSKGGAPEVKDSDSEETIISREKEKV